MTENTLEISVSTVLYPQDAILKTGYWYSGRFDVRMTEGLQLVLVTITGTTECPVPEGLEREFFKNLLDQVLRQSIQEETKVIREQIMRTALAEALRP